MYINKLNLIYVYNFMCFEYFCQWERQVKFLKDGKFSLYKIFIQKLPTQLYCYIEQ